jgi:uncharacterized protein (TIGR03067 family)
MNTLLIVVAGLFVVGSKPDDDVKKELGKLEGTWKTVAQEANGKREDKDKIKKHDFVFEGEKLIIKDAKKSREHSIKIDPKQTPKTIELTDPEGDPVGRGIYKLDGDSLTIAITKPSFDRPTEFTTKKGSNHVVVVLKREKP